jgi:histidyl-tRNA synthetase
VWRADRPQKGRFREFYQCDADVVGANSLLQEVELIQLYDAVFADLKLDGVVIKINHRKILSGIAEIIGAQEHLIAFTVALDKLDKIGKEGVIKEMLKNGISAAAVEKATPLLDVTSTDLDALQLLKEFLKDSEEGTKGIEELKSICSTIDSLGLKTAQVVIDSTLARGLNYYTGAIFEVAAPPAVAMGSIGGGGRYDDLTGIFGLKNLSGVGISFGLDRIYLVLEELGLFPKKVDQSVQVLFVNFGTEEALAALRLAGSLRSKGIKTDVYPTDTKIQKQMKHANNRNIPYVVLLGEQELANKSFVVKDMEKGEQKTYSWSDIDTFANLL